MLENRLTTVIVAAAVIIVGTSASDVSAQARRGEPVERAGAAGAKEQIRVKIKKLKGLDRQGRVETPEIKSSYARSSSKRGEWCEISTEYSTYNEWIDELTFSYYVLTKSTTEGERGYSFYRCTVRYVDIAKDSDHCSTVYLRPQTVERYGWPVAVGVVITAGGEEVAKESDSSIPMPRDVDWWKSSAVIESAKVQVTTRDGKLLNRNQTPFALLNIDDYEVIQ